MNELSLRLSAIKSNENLKKNSEIRMEMIDTTHMFPESENEFLKIFKTCSTIEDQTRLLRQFSDTLAHENETLKIYITLYLKAPLKHAVRNSIAKILLQKRNINDNITNVLSKILTETIDQINLTENSSENFNRITNIISGCFENIEFTRSTLDAMNSILLSYFLKCLKFYLSKFDTCLSPAEISEICIYLHNTIRVAIAYFQQFPLIIIAHENIDTVKNIMEQAEKLLENENLPMDTKINCGILLVVYTKITHSMSRLLEKIYNLNTPRVTILCYSIGIISCLDKNYFQTSEDVYVLQFLHKVSTVLTKLTDTVYAEPNFILGVSRGFMQMTKKLSVMTITRNTDNTELLSEISFQALDYSLGYLEYHSDSIRYMSTEILKHLLKIDRQNELGIIDKVILFVKLNFKKENLMCSSQFTVITCISNVLSAGVVLDSFPNVGDIIIKSLHNNDNAINNNNILKCYESLMNSSFKQNDTENWFELWVKPLIVISEKRKCSDDSNDVMENLYVLIEKSIKIHPEIIYEVVKLKNNINFEMILICLSQAKKLGLFDNIESSDVMWKELIPYEELRDAMISSEDNKRISALTLLAESHKTTELFSNDDLKSIEFFIHYNINVQNPSLRSKISSIFRNIFIRLSVGMKDTHKAHESYMEFIHSLYQFCVNNLADGANISRKQISFKLLLEIFSMYNKHNIIFNWKPQHVQVFLNSLSDSYENNKQYAIDILKFCPIDILAKYNYNINLITIEELLKSVKTAHSVTAAYYLEFLLLFQRSEESGTSCFPEIYNLLLFCERLLNEGLELARLSLLNASKVNPLYGSLFSIRHLLNKSDYKKIAEHAEWRELISRILRTCIELSEIVGIVVNNSSPEGYLPDDLIQSEGDETLAESQKDLIAQRVLVCAWRTAKEVSLILGDIAFKSPILNRQLNNPTYGLIESSDILLIGCHFTKLLSETKHRGAFEQTYIGFSFLCLRLWSAPEIELHKLPMKWLEQMIDMIVIHSENNIQDRLNTATSNLAELNLDKVCSTRRSAGIPFMMQALITSEFQVSSSKGLKFCMQNLMRICRNSTKIESRTHSLNILRTLFRATDLSDAVAEFVADGIECAIRGYDAVTWTEKNSSTLLYSALMVRVFGVQRTRDTENLNIRNKMTGRIFFLRYPQLYDFFLKELNDAGQIISQGGRTLKLHPLLLLLDRLYPSSLEGSESNLQLSNFVPLISKCGGCPEMKTRYLAARSIANIISPDLIIRLIFQNFDRLTATTPMNLNYCHGSLLEILFLLKSVSESSTELFNENIELIIELLLQIENVMPVVDKSAILQGAYVDIILELYTKFNTVIVHPEVQFGVFLNYVIDYIESRKLNVMIDYDYTLARKIVHLRVVLFTVLSLKPIDLLLIPDEKQFKNIDVIETILNVYLLLLDYNKFKMFSEDYDIAPVEIELIKFYKLSENSDTEDIAIPIERLVGIIRERTTADCAAKALTVLSYTKSLGMKIFLKTDSLNVNSLRKLIELGSNRTDQEQIAIYNCFHTVLKTIEDDSDSLVNLDFAFIDAISGPENPDNLRLVASQIMATISKKILLRPNFNINQVLTYSRIILVLLNDDDIIIRRCISKLILGLQCEYYKREPNNENIVSLYAQKVYLKLLSDLLRENGCGRNIVGAFFFLLIKSNDDLTLEATIMDHRIFDKNEVNIFAEKFVLTEDCRKHIFDVVGKDKIDIDQFLAEALEFFPTSKEELHLLPDFLNSM